ncbi:hypothetical protein HUS67_14200 [Cobetia marina]|nr:hypothetical protein [Cobetia marina]
MASSTLVTSSTPETRHSSIAPTTQGYVNARQDRLPPSRPRDRAHADSALGRHPAGRQNLAAARCGSHACRDRLALPCRTWSARA